MKTKPVKLPPLMPFPLRLPQPIINRIVEVANARKVRPGVVAREWLTECAAGVRR